MKKRFFGASLLAVLACVLVACGGGGGGGGGSSSGGGSNSGGLSVTADRSALQFYGFAGNAAASQDIHFTLTAAEAGTYYGQIVPDQTGLFSASFTPNSNTTATVTVMPTSTAALVRSGSMTFRLCRDTGCNDVAWTTSIPYTLSIFQVDPSSLALSGYEGATASATLTVTPADTAGLLSIGASDTWLTAQRSTAGSIGVTAAAAGKAAGTYRGQVNVGFSGVSGAPTLQIPVAFTVGKGIVAGAAQTLTLDAHSTAASLAGSTQAAFNGGLAPAWTATSDQPWLVVDTASGNGPGPVAFHVDTTKTASIDNWSTATAQLTLHVAGMTDVPTPISLSEQLPELYWVTPSVIPAGRASTVRLTGRGLSQLSGVGQLTLAGVSVNSGSIVSDNSAVLDLSALSAGRYAASVPNTLGLATATTQIGAASLSSLSAGTAANAGLKDTLLFDPTRNSAYAVNQTQNTLVRYRLSGGQWIVDGLPVASIGGMAMSPDRRLLYVSSGYSQLLAIDPDTLQTVSSYTFSGQQYGSNLSEGLSGGIAVTSSMKLWFGGDQWSAMTYFDLLHGRFGTQQTSGLLGTFYSPRYLASGDGSTMLMEQYGISPEPNALIYRSATDSLVASASAPNSFLSARFSEDASLLLANDKTLYKTSDFSLIGSVQVSGAIVTRSALSPDGHRLYALVTQSQKSQVVNHVNVYDTATVTPGTSALTLLGQIAVEAQSSSCTGGSSATCDSVGVFTISPLGDTLFWVGNVQLVVMPIPANLSSIQSVPSRLKAAVR